MEKDTKENLIQKESSYINRIKQGKSFENEVLLINNTNIIIPAALKILVKSVKVNDQDFTAKI